MKKFSFALFACVLSLNSVHAESLLTLSFDPGYVSNRYVFDNTCNLTSDGKLVYTSAKTGVGAGQVEILKTFTKQIAASEISEITVAIEEIRKLGENKKTEYETFSGDIADYTLAAYAPTTESEADSETPNPKFLGMHYNGISFTKSKQVRELLVQMSEYCQMSEQILKTSLAEMPKRIQK